MKHNWKKLLSLAGGRKIRITRFSVPSDGISVEGDFALPPLAELDEDDQLFVMAFVQTHGSIKQMEKIFGISYPTVKNRLTRIADSFKLFDVQIKSEEPASGVLDKLQKGDISVEEALKELE